MIIWGLLMPTPSGSSSLEVLVPFTGTNTLEEVSSSPFFKLTVRIWLPVSSLLLVDML